jgi:hypothetical protein
MNIIILLWGLVTVILRPYLMKKYRLVATSFLIFVLISVLFLYESSFSFLYELYKLSLFVLFVPLMASFSRLTILKLDKKLLTVLVWLFAINLLLISLQYLFSPSVITYLGLPAEQVTVSTKAGRWVGVFEGVNTMGDTALLLFILTAFLRPRNYKMYLFVFLGSVLISTSKHAISVLILFVIIYGLTSSTVKEFVAKNKTRAIWIVPFILIFGGVAFVLNESAVKSKVNQYSYFFSNMTSITRQDARFIEKRALYSGLGVSIMLEAPLGVGLGVWGDTSSRFNEKNYPFIYVEMCDSSMIHMLVEQGVFFTFYVIFLLSGIFSARRNGNGKEFVILLLALFFIDLVTMGLSSGSWPLFFAYIYGRLYWGPVQLANEKKSYVEIESKLRYFAK